MAAFAKSWRRESEARSPRNDQLTRPACNAPTGLGLLRPQEP
jgi:hypothetical protein